MTAKNTRPTSGSWWVCYEYSCASGRKRLKTEYFFKTRAEAEDKLAQLQRLRKIANIGHVMFATYG